MVGHLASIHKTLGGSVTKMNTNEGIVRSIIDYVCLYWLCETVHCFLPCMVLLSSPSHSSVCLGLETVFHYVDTLPRVPSFSLSCSSAAVIGRCVPSQEILSPFSYPTTVPLVPVYLDYIKLSHLSVAHGRTDTLKIVVFSNDYNSLFISRGCMYSTLK